MRTILVILTLISFSRTSQGQDKDSLYSVWLDISQPDSNRVEAYYTFIWNGHLFNNPDSAFKLAELLIEFNSVNSYPKAEAKAFKIQGVSFALKGNYAKTLYYFQKSLKISKAIGDLEGVASALGNIGGVYYEQNDYAKALAYNLQCLEIQKELGNNEFYAKSLGNIGNIYVVQNNYSKAIEYYEQGLKMHKEMKSNSGIANTLGLIAYVKTKQGQYEEALTYNQRSLKIRLESKDKYGISNSHRNMGDIYLKQNMLTEALDHYKKGLEVSKAIADRKTLASFYIGLGNVYNAQGKYKNAVIECKKALLLGKEVGVINIQKEAYSTLYQAYKGLGNGNDALVYFEKMQVMVDSLHVEETNKKLQQMEFAKEVLADSLANAEEARLIEEAHQAEVKKKNRTRNMLAGGGLLLLLIAGGVYSRLRFTRKAKAAVEHEKDRSDNLLLNILPADIAEELKTHGKAEARDFDQVSILFTDFKGFTSASANMNAKDLVSNINHCFKAFDIICEKYKIEKIKTIGDAYMAAGGLPIPSEDSVTNTVLAALEMQQFITKLHNEKEAQGEHAFQMRVGIHTGPVVAGIVGVKKFQYDIWGDTVNTAARMESNGIVEKVNISQDTYEMIKDDSSFEFEHRGKVEAKGKGEIDMYFVSTV